MRFWNRGDARFEAELRAARSRPSDEYVRALSRQIERGGSGRVSRLARLSFATAVTALMLVTFASLGGLGYAASAPVKAVKAVKAAVAPDTTQGPQERQPHLAQQSSGQAQYGPQKVTICHVLPNGRQVTLTISEAALSAHLDNHGDFLGPCP